jgi:hypothetical protein
MNILSKKLTVSLVVALVIGLGYVGATAFINSKADESLAAVATKLTPVSDWRQHWLTPWDTRNPSIQGGTGADGYFKCADFYCADTTLPAIEIISPKANDTITINRAKYDDYDGKFLVKIEDKSRLDLVTSDTSSLGLVHVQLVGKNNRKEITIGGSPVEIGTYDRKLAYNFVRKNGIWVNIPRNVQSGEYKLRVLVAGIGYTQDPVTFGRSRHRAVGERIINIVNNQVEAPASFVKVLSPASTTRAYIQDKGGIHDPGYHLTSFKLNAEWLDQDFPTGDISEGGSKFSAYLINDAGNQVKELVKNRLLQVCQSDSAYAKRGMDKDMQDQCIHINEMYITLPYGSIDPGIYRLKLILTNRDGLSVTGIGERFKLDYWSGWEKTDKDFFSGRTTPTTPSAGNSNVTPSAPPADPFALSLTVTSPSASSIVAVGSNFRIKSTHVGLTNKDLVKVYLKKEGSSTETLIGTSASATSTAGTYTKAQVCPTNGGACNNLLTSTGLIRKIPNGTEPGKYKIKVVVFKEINLDRTITDESDVFTIQ